MKAIIIKSGDNVNRISFKNEAMAKKLFDSINTEAFDEVRMDNIPDTFQQKSARFEVKAGDDDESGALDFV